MGLWVAIGADSQSGHRTIDCLCATDEQKIKNKANTLGHFVSDIYLVDKSKSRLGKFSTDECANWLKNNDKGLLALELLQIHNLIPERFSFHQTRWAVPFFLAAGKTNLAWAAIQEVKISEFSNSMYCIEAEKIHLIELELHTLKADDRYPQASYFEVAYRLASAFLPNEPDRETFVDIQASIAADDTGLDECMVKAAAEKIYDEYLRSGSVSAIMSASSIIQSEFE